MHVTLDILAGVIISYFDTDVTVWSESSIVRTVQGLILSINYILKPRNCPENISLNCNLVCAMRLATMIDKTVCT